MVNFGEIVVNSKGSLVISLYFNKEISLCLFVCNLNLFL